MNQKNDIGTKPNSQQTEHSSDTLKKILPKGSPLKDKIWLGAQKTSKVTTANSLDSGYQALNKELHSGGWPLNTCTELGLSQHGIGELRLLLPALRLLQQTAHQRQNIIWVAPPFLPYAPALIKEEIDPRKLTIVRTNNIQDTLWSTEQALLSESCAAVFCWTSSHNLNNRELRRLQLASEKTNTWNVLFRHNECLKQPSASGLRIALESNSYSKLELHILKQPNGWGGQYCCLSLAPHYEHWQRLPAHLLPHHNQAQTPNLPKPSKAVNSNRHQQSSVTVLTSLATLKTAH